MKNQNSYQKRILLSVTGMSPAVVTETLYALVTEKGFIPTEIRIITTLQGKRRLLDDLLGIAGGRPAKSEGGALNDFIRDYGQQYGFDHIHFDEACITVIEDKDGNPLEDIRTPEENEFASDKIVSLVGELCQDEDSAIHVSIAGGRKTMGFFLGYALSLYGRVQDSLSHVLVPTEFETKDFYYPKPTDYEINNEKGHPIDISKAKVMLAEIPWVRLGLGVSEDLLHNRISYSESVNKAQQILQKPSITFLDPIDDRKVKFGNNVIRISEKEYALLLSIALANEKNIETSYYDKAYMDLYFRIYAVLKSNSDKMEKRLGLTKPDHDYDACKEVLSESATHLKKKITQLFSLGKNTDSPYVPSAKGNKYTLDVKDIDYSQIANIF